MKASLLTKYHYLAILHEKVVNIAALELVCKYDKDRFFKLRTFFWLLLKQ
jgi:hypothetical protein